VGSNSYLESFPDEDKDRIFKFFTIFSRWERALKRHYPKKGNYEVAEAGWDQFVDQFASEIAADRGQEYEVASAYLVAAPPKVQIYREDADPRWEPNPRRTTKAEDRYLLRVMRDVRNNLFHGGK
jgi:hypothetical protein